MITFKQEDFERKLWKLGKYEYSSAPTLGAGEFAVFAEQILRAVAWTPLVKDMPDEKRSPDKYREWLDKTLNAFIVMYSEQTQRIICDSILFPVGDAPSVMDAYRQASIEEKMKVYTFFLTSAIPNSLNGLSLSKSGVGIRPKAKGSRSKTTSRKYTKTVSESRARQAWGASKSISKATA